MRRITRQTLAILTSEVTKLKFYFQKLKKSCSVCEEIINGVYYCGPDNRILCEAHYKVQDGLWFEENKFYLLQKQLGNCERCGETLDGSILKIDGAKYHLACFTCKICSVNLKDGSVLRDEQRAIYCQSCHDK